jgi:hypothetical protein
MAKAIFRPADGSSPVEIVYSATEADQAIATRFHAKHRHEGYNPNPRHYEYCTACCAKCEPMATRDLRFRDKPERLNFTKRFNLCPSCLSQMIADVEPKRYHTSAFLAMEKWCRKHFVNKRLRGLDRTFTPRRTPSPDSRERNPHGQAACRDVVGNSARKAELTGGYLAHDRR